MVLNKNIEIKLNEQFKKWSGSEALQTIKLPNSGSNRMYFRLQNSNISAIGVYNDNFKENTTFLNFTKQFLNSRINVPFIYSENLCENIYLIQDLGDTQMLQWLSSQRTKNEFPTEAISIYKKVIQELIRIQIIAGRNFDYSSCYPYTVFNEESIKFDLNYFISNYIERLNLNYDSKKLGSDFNQFTSYLLKADNDFFMFRDFQARNIMLVNNQLYFIDYQGGRKGPLQYDLASLLFQAMAKIPEKIKDLLLEYYIGLAQKFVPLNKSEFIEHYYAFALIRVMQTLGAYGLRGLIEKKNHFIKSIPLAIQNLIYLVDKVEILNSLPELKKIIIQITSIETKTNEE